MLREHILNDFDLLIYWGFFHGPECGTLWILQIIQKWLPSFKKFRFLNVNLYKLMSCGGVIYSPRYSLPVCLFILLFNTPLYCIFVLLYLPVWLISTKLTFSSLILSSEPSSVMVIPFKGFFISDIMFFLSKISFILFLMVNAFILIILFFKIYLFIFIEVQLI